jgi:hypothetical protein
MGNQNQNQYQYLDKDQDINNYKLENMQNHNRYKINNLDFKNIVKDYITIKNTEELLKKIKLEFYKNNISAINNIHEYYYKYNNYGKTEINKNETELIIYIYKL